MSTSKTTLTSNTTLTAKTLSRLRRMERQNAPWTLEQAEGAGADRSFVINKNEMILGSAKDANIHVRSDRLSPRHAVLERKGADCVIRDCDSNSGIFLNGLKIHSAVLHDGDVIQAGDAVFVFRES
jgi:pSer/pThr/pTyr-binding forkhead associated (FHA) protein